MIPTIQQDLLEQAPLVNVRELPFKPYVFPWLSDLPLYVILEPNDAPVFVLVDENSVMYEYGEDKELLVFESNIGLSDSIFGQFLSRRIIYRVVFPVSKRITHKINKKRRQKYIGKQAEILANLKISSSAFHWFMKKRYALDKVQRMGLDGLESFENQRFRSFIDSIRILHKAFSDIQAYGGYQGAMKILEQNLDRTDWSAIDYELVDAIEIYEACILSN